MDNATNTYFLIRKKRFPCYKIYVLDWIHIIAWKFVQHYAHTYTFKLCLYMHEINNPVKSEFSLCEYLDNCDCFVNSSMRN